MSPVVPPRHQGWLLAATLAAGVLRVATYDAPPGVRSRDMGTVVDATLARSSARLVVRGDVVVEGYALRVYAEGVVSFDEDRASLTVSLPGAVSAEGPPPQYDLRVSDHSAYVRALGSDAWYAFPSRGVGTFVPDPFLLLDMAAHTSTVRRIGGESVRGAGCDHYRGNVTARGLRLPPRLTRDGTPPLRVDAWVAADGVPRRVSLSVQGKDGDLLRVTLDLFRYDTPVTVDVPDGSVDVSDSTAAFEAMGS